MTALGTGGREIVAEGGGRRGAGSNERQSFLINHYTSAYRGIPCSPYKCPEFSSVADQDDVVGSCPWTVWFITPSNCNAQEMMYRKEGY